MTLKMNTDEGGAIAVERWLPCVGYEGRYEVSSLGRVRSLERVETDKLGRPHPVKGCMLKLHLNHDGYLQVPMRLNGKLRMERVHRLVALTFHPNKQNALHSEAAHLDGDRANARADNIQWVSRCENLSHRVLHGTDCRGERHVSAKLTNAQAAEIRALRGKATYAELARRFKVRLHTIDDVMRGKRYATAVSADHRLSRLVPTFTHRTHKAPLPRSHRAFSLGKAEWR